MSNSIVKSDKYALNLTEGHISTLIKNAEKIITDKSVELQNKLPGFKEAEEMYVAEKQGISEITDEIDAQKALVSLLVNFNKRPSKNKELRVMRATSHLDAKKRKTTGRYFRWMENAAIALEKADHFMSKEELFEAILKNNPEMKSFFEENKQRGYTAKYSFFNNIDTETKKKNKTENSIIKYNNKYGLLNWMTDENVPESKYLDQVLFRSDEHHKTSTLKKVAK